MPILNIMVSKDVTKQQETAVKTNVGKAISAFPGKSESYLMVNIVPHCHLYFGGKNDTPCAIGELKIFGSSTREYYEKFTAEFCKIMEQELGISQDKTYITYQGIENWGYNGFNF